LTCYSPYRIHRCHHHHHNKIYSVLITNTKQEQRAVFKNWVDKQFHVATMWLLK